MSNNIVLRKESCASQENLALRKGLSFSFGVTQVTTYYFCNILEIENDALFFRDVFLIFCYIIYPIYKIANIYHAGQMRYMQYMTYMQFFFPTFPCYTGFIRHMPMQRWSGSRFS